MADDEKKEKKGEKHAGGEKAAGEKKPDEKKASGEKKAGGERRAKGKGKGEHAEAASKKKSMKEVKLGPARLRVRFDKEVIPTLMKELGYKNPMQVPRLHKIVLNMGMGEALATPKLLDGAVDQLAAMTGQKPVVTKARKAIANFKLREGQSIGAMVTLRKDRMYEFFDRLVNVALPRVRDFKGVSPKAFDGRGNYTLGLREQVIFPEVNYDEVEKIKGLNVSIVTTARNDEQGRALLRHLGMPFRQ
jgi:large subunit ribosomal protein L5